MIDHRRRLGVAAAVAVAATASLFLLAPGLRADSNQDIHPPMHAMPGHGGADMPAMPHHAGRAAGAMPIMSGQDAFGAVQEIVRILEADPSTDWSKVNLEALRQHLIDMNEVTLEADEVAKPIEGGIEVAVTGTGRTVAAIQRMVPAHAHAIDETHLNHWRAQTEALNNGVLLRVTSSDANEVARIRALGFIGIMVSGQHHQPHHLAMARGEMVH
jgi:hypothetical protein